MTATALNYDTIAVGDALPGLETPPISRLTLALYCSLYRGLLVAYVAVVRHLAEKPEASLVPAGRALPSRAFA